MLMFIAGMECELELLKKICEAKCDGGDFRYFVAGRLYYVDDSFF